MFTIDGIYVSLRQQIPIDASLTRTSLHFFVVGQRTVCKTSQPDLLSVQCQCKKAANSQQVSPIVEEDGPKGVATNQPSGGCKKKLWQQARPVEVSGLHEARAGQPSVLAGLLGFEVQGGSC